MANEKNLKNLADRPQRERKEIARMGAKASNEKQRRKKELRECLEELLNMEMKDKTGKTMTGAEAISAKLFEKALHGDIKAFEVVRDSAGQKPIEQIQIAEVDQTTVDEIERLWHDEATGDSETEN